MVATVMTFSTMSRNATVTFFTQLNADVGWQFGHSEHELLPRKGHYYIDTIDDNVVN